MLIITPKKKEYYDCQMSAKYVEFIECNDVQAEDTAQAITDCDTHVIEAVIVGPNLICDTDGIVISSRWKQQEITLRLNEEACKEINKCINDLFRYFKGFVSFDLLQRSVYNWIYKAYSKETVDSLCTYIENEIAIHTSSYLFLFPLPYIQLQDSIRIGNVCLGHENSDERIKKLLSEIGDDVVVPMTTASITLEGEMESAKEKARELVQFAIDILKVCSSLKYREESYIYNFELENNQKAGNECVCYVYDSQKEILHKEIKTNYLPFCLDGREKAIFDTNTTFSLMSHFLTDYYILLNHKHTELDKIIMRSIRQFSITLSTKNQYERIVKLCSILDAAILKDNEAGIKESLKKYIPILVSEDLTMRETVNQTLELMYSVRSDYIHHGKEAKVEFQEIIDMNIIVLSTIIRFLQLRHTYESPKMIIKAIDKLQLSVHL